MIRVSALLQTLRSGPSVSLFSPSSLASTSRLPALAPCRCVTTPAGAATTPPAQLFPRKRHHPLTATGPKAYKWQHVAKNEPVPRPQRIPPAVQPITTPADFLEAISSKPRRDLTANSSLVGLLGEEWEKMWTLTNVDFRKAGVGVKERRYVLWSMEKFRQGWKPDDFRILPKPKKRFRGWGPRVQDGIRVRGVKRAGERSA